MNEPIIDIVYYIMAFDETRDFLHHLVQPADGQHTPVQGFRSNRHRRPQEFFHCKPDLLEVFRAAGYAELQSDFWNRGCTDNGVFSIKHSFYEPQFGQLIEELRKLPGCPTYETNRPTIWESAFPNHRHIFMTRRNKVRLAVSWWKTIQTQEWHLLPGQSHKEIDLSNAYSYDAINHLSSECSMREAGIKKFFAEGRIIPLHIFYEDFIEHYEQTIRRVL